MTIDGNEVIDILWESGIEARLKEKDEDLTVLDIPGRGVDIGRAWSEGEDDDDWVFDVGDIAIFVDNEFYCQYDGETADDLVNVILEVLGE